MRESTGEGGNAKTPLDVWNVGGVFENKPGDTYFRAGRHYHRPGKLNGCVRDGNRCFLSGMVARRGAARGKAERSLILTWFELARAAGESKKFEVRSKMSELEF